MEFEDFESIDHKTAKKNGNFFPCWTDEKTDLLIKCRLENDDLFKGRATSESWQTILNEMQKSCDMESFLEVHLSKKWANLCRIYKECQRFLSTTRLPLSYYYVFDNYYKNKEKKKRKTRTEENCRLCQASIGEYTLAEDKNLCNIINNLISINVGGDPENFPKKICIVCKTNLDSFTSFVNQSKLVDEALRSKTKEITLNILLNCPKSILDEAFGSRSKEITPKILPNHSENVINDLEFEFEFAIENHIGSNILSKQSESANANIEVVTVLPDHPEINDLKTIPKRITSNIPPNHDEKNDYTCQICAIRFKKENSLSNHLRKKHQIESNVKQNSDHQIESNEADNVIVNQSFKRESDNEEVYLEYDSNDYKEEIEDIEEKVDVEQTVEKIETLNKQEIYTCMICMKQFESRGRFRTHEKHHRGIKHKCPRKDCNKTYTTLQSIKAHELRDHQGVKRCLCTICGKGFSGPVTLKIHEKMHKGERDIECEICKKKFYTNSNLYMHKRVYHFGYLHMCSQCPRSFISKSSLDRHEAVHTGVKEFKCNDCDSCFYTNRELGWHIKRVHKIEKKFNCTICYKSFHTKYSLNIHSRIHTGEKPFPCEFAGCEKRFRVKRKMTDHLKIHNKANANG